MEIPQHSYQGITGLPSPSSRNHQQYFNLIFMAVEWAHKERDAPNCITDQIADHIIHTSFLIHGSNEWETKFKESQRKARLFYHNPDSYWRAIALGISTPEVEGICLQMLPCLDREKYFNHIPVDRSILNFNFQSSPTPIKEILSREFLPRIRKRQWHTVSEYILKKAPSRSVEKVYLTALACCRNKKSGKGRKVYPYGQRYIAKINRVSLITVTRAWSWLQHQGIFNKAWNENPKEHRCAGWYVCTSMKQVSYFRDPENLHRKTER